MPVLFIRLARRWLTLSLFGLMLSAGVTPASASANVVVGNGTRNSCNETALNNAIATVNQARGGTISFNCGGAVTIPITSQKVFTGRNAVYTLNGNNQVTLDGQGNHRLIYTGPGQNLTFTVRNITLLNGNARRDAQGERAANQGGAIYSGNENTLIVDNVTFQNNVARAERNVFHGGGAIAIDYSSHAIVRNSTFIDNSAPNGGAINNLLSILTIENSFFRRNSATLAGPGGGGAIYNDAGTVKIKHSIIRNNQSANLGGGVFTWTHIEPGFEAFAGKTVINNTTIFNNHARHGGGVWKGGIYLMTLKNSTVANNTSIDGGAGLSGTGPNVNFKIVNSTITGNIVQQTGSGAGLFSVHNTSTIINSTIAYNRVPHDAHSVGGAIRGDVTLRNTIIAHNSGGWNNTWSCMGNISNGGNNLQFPDDTCGAIPVRDPHIDPQLFPAPGNVTVGGTTPTHAILSNSPAFDRGANCPKKDQRGVNRPQGNACDIGAYELIGTPPTDVAQVSPVHNTSSKGQNFRWTSTTGAQEYKLVIKAPNGNKIFSRKITAGQANCNPTCTMSVSVPYKAGKKYSWRVIAINPFGKAKSLWWKFVAK